MLRALILIGAFLTSQQAGSLGLELANRGLPPPPKADDLNAPISSYSVLDDEKGFAIGYYFETPDGRLHDLRIRSYDKRSGIWRLLELKEPIGSVA